MRAAVVSVVALAACGRLDFDAGRRGVLTLADPGETLVDFPLLVVLDDDRVDRAELAPDASNLAFFAADGTPLATEIESAGAAGGASLYAWVRVPVITGAATTLTMTTGGAAGARDEVWTDGYEAVWHMAGSGVVADSTAHQRDGVPRGTSSTVGPVGPARAFDHDAQDAIVVPGLASVPLPGLTASAWMRFHSAPTDGFYAAVTRELGDGGQDDFILGTQNLVPLGGVSFDPTGGGAAFGANVGLDEWHAYTETFDGAHVTLYLDGEQVGEMDTIGTLATSAGPVYLGCDRDNNAATSPPAEPDHLYLDGELDEVRVESVARSPAWIAYDVAAMQDRVITYAAP